MTAKKIHLGPAQIACDLGDGSERGEYVNQDYILHTLGRPHRAINLMYCYYPLDEGWPARASTLPMPDGGKVGYAWDYAYDDYFPYTGGLEGDTTGEVFQQMRDVRRHGQDVILTLAMDCGVSDAQLERIADDLAPFGRLMLRINHEAMGQWFAFNKRYTYQQVGDFFVRFHRILKARAPHIRTVLCVGDGHVQPTGRLKYEDEFAEAIRVADMWSADTYLSLHWGWPFDIAEPGGNSHKRVTNEAILEGLNFEYERFMARGEGKTRDFVLSEFNADGDVSGPYEQATQITDFYRQLPVKAPFITGVTLYQFRDRGRLGLEIEDPSNPAVGYAQPILEAYKAIMQTAPYLPAITDRVEYHESLATQDAAHNGCAFFPANLRWGGSEDADGIALVLEFEKSPTFCEITFANEDAPLNLMLEINGRWFYKAPDVTSIDLMPAFFATNSNAKHNNLSSDAGDACFAMDLRIFAPPPGGTNDPGQGDGWETNYRTTMQKTPEMRIRYAPVM